jgi:hypothetical protein
VFIPWNRLLQLEADEIGPILWVVCGKGLTYGLLHPDHAKSALDNERRGFVAVGPEWIRAGLQIPSAPPWPDNDAYFAWLEQIVRAYETVVEPLPPAYPELLRASVVQARLALG